MTSPFITNRNGTCITPEGLDDLWPRDDRPVDTTSWAFRTFSGGKGGKALPTCAPGTLTYQEQVALEGHDLFAFTFDGQTLDPSTHVVPVGGSLIWLATAALMTAALKWRKAR